ncbi:DUF3499 domain-containing protein [Mycobacterium spongiae]|uniref:DUF3499 domain-containing protein n=1 Tax=Mycobacterium spongiae TaxID=886343 RepID=UPI001BAA7416|nr:DUF3499 domain-containing protein [Mycobacterium spongiae]
MNVPRRCCRPGCPHHAVATLTFVYSDSTAVIGPLATAREPHSWDLCVGHAGRITAPRGWELVRHAGPLPTHPDEDDLVALADAVREGSSTGMGLSYAAGTGASLDEVPRHPGGDMSTRAGGGTSPWGHGSTDTRFQPAGAQATATTGGVLAPSEHRSGRRRGHLRVLPDPAD